MPIVRAAVLLVFGVLSLSGPALSASTSDATLARLSRLDGRAFDAAFMQVLIPVDDEAIEIAMTATLYADHAELLRWNQSFVERERGHVRQMLAWLQDMGSKPAERNEGVATASVKKMRALRGAALERAYLPLMASHLNQSVALARLAVKKASQPALRSFAQEIVRVETQEETTLRGWLKTWQ